MGRLGYLWPANRAVGIKIEYHKIRLLRLVYPASPCMDLESTHLSQRNQAGYGIYGQPGSLCLLIDRNPLDVFRDRIRCVFLIEALFVRALRAAEKHERTVPDMGHSPLSNCFVVAHDLNLGNS